MTYVLILMMLFHSSVVPAALAQTAAMMSGAVTDAQGGALPGAVVVATHLPTGVTAETVTGPDGRFSFATLRPGGPYKVTVDDGGFRRPGAPRDSTDGRETPRASTSSCRSPRSARR